MYNLKQQRHSGPDGYREKQPLAHEANPQNTTSLRAQHGNLKQQRHCEERSNPPNRSTTKTCTGIKKLLICL